MYGKQERDIVTEGTGVRIQERKGRGGMGTRKNDTVLTKISLYNIIFQQIKMILVTNSLGSWSRCCHDEFIVL